MPNPFIDSARTILATLDDDLAAQLAEAARQTSIAASVALTIEEALALALVARHIAATDGLSEAESTGMRALLDFYGVPEAAQAALHRVDLGAASDEHIRELVPRPRQGPPPGQRGRVHRRPRRPLRGGARADRRDRRQARDRGRDDRRPRRRVGGRGTRVDPRR